MIKAARRRRGLTQSALAALAGTTQPVVSAYEHGRRDPSMATLRKLVEASGERMVIEMVPRQSDLAPSANPEEHGRRLLDVLSLADAVPLRRRGRVLQMPRLVSL